MKALQTLSQTKLQQMELVGLSRETVTDIEKSGVELLTTDVPLQRYVKDVKDNVDPFEVATRNPDKDPYTEILQQKDRLRDRAFSRFGRKLHYYEFDEDPAKRAAYNNLFPLWRLHRDIPHLNPKNQTNATDNFLNDSAKEPYASAIVTLTMTPELDGISNTNNGYRASEEDSRALKAVEETSEGKELRRKLQNANKTLFNYIYTLANAYSDNAEWDKLLTAVNVVRKRYHELLSHREGQKDEDDKPKKLIPKTGGNKII